MGPSTEVRKLHSEKYKPLKYKSKMLSQQESRQRTREKERDRVRETERQRERETERATDRQRQGCVCVGEGGE